MVEESGPVPFEALLLDKGSPLLNEAVKAQVKLPASASERCCVRECMVNVPLSL